MADFCKQCSIEFFGEDTRDFAGICAEDEVAWVLCEECGYIPVNHLGERIESVEIKDK